MLKLINCLKCHRSFTHSLLLFCSFPTPVTRVQQRLHLKMGFKVHIGWTQLATLVAVETRLTHGQVVENSVSGSLRGYRGLSRFMDFTLHFYRPSGSLSTSRKNIHLHTDTKAFREISFGFHNKVIYLFILI